MTTQEQNQNKNVALRQSKEVIENVENRVKEMAELGAIKLPSDYIPGNALKLAWLHLQAVETKDKKPVLEACTRESIANALLEMAIKGMSVARKHGYFIAYGNRLTFQPDYRGNLMVAKRDADVKQVNARVIYEKDNYVTTIDETGVKKLLKHEQPIENVDINKIKGAYAVVVFNDGSTKLEEMTIAQVKNAWLQGAAKGNSGAHTNFADQMAIKTVINRALKIEIGSADDSEIVTDDEPTNTPKGSRGEEVKRESATKEVKVEDTDYEDVSSSSTQPQQQDQSQDQSTVTEEKPKQGTAVEIDQKF